MYEQAETLDNRTMADIEATSTRIRIYLYPQTFCYRFKSLYVHTYLDSLRFRASTRIRENDTKRENRLKSMHSSILWARQTFVHSFYRKEWLGKSLVIP